MSGFNLDKLNAAVKGFQDKKNDGPNEYPQTVFLPDGNHKGRFIIDPMGEPFIDYYSYGFFARGIRDPRNDTGVPEGFVNELEKLYKEGFQPRNQWSKGSKYNVLAYFYLYETDAPSEDWKPNTLYVIVSNNKFGESYTNFLATLAKEAPEEIMKTLSPDQKGVVLLVSMKSGTQGSCSISAGFPTKIADPIDMTGKPYIPLDLAYIRPGFNQEKYDALVKRYKDELAKLGAIDSANGAGNHSATPPADIPTSVGQSMINAGTPTTQPVAAAAPAQESVAQTAPVTQVATPAEQPVQAQAQPAATPAVDTSVPFDANPKPEAQATPPAAGADAADPWAKFRTA